MRSFDLNQNGTVLGDCLMVGSPWVGLAVPESETRFGAAAGLRACGFPFSANIGQIKIVTPNCEQVVNSTAINLSGGPEIDLAARETTGR